MTQTLYHHERPITDEDKRIAAIIFGDILKGVEDCKHEGKKKFMKNRYGNPFRVCLECNAILARNPELDKEETNNGKNNRKLRRNHV